MVEMPARQKLGLLLAVSVSLAACGSAAPPVVVPSPVATLAFVAAPLTLSGLTLTTATLQLDHIRVLGDSQPAPPPPGSQPPVMDSLSFDALGNTLSTAADGGTDAGTQTIDGGTDGGVGQTITQEIPQGLYSRVELMVHDVTLAGTWKGTAFTAHLAMFQHTRVELRAVATQEVVNGDTLAYTVTVAPSRWFVDGMMQPILDSATLTGGTITCDDMNNQAVAMALTAQFEPSFSVK
jgi:hypothetical protein